MNFMQNLKIHTHVITMLCIFGALLGVTIGLHAISSSKVHSYVDMVGNLNIDQLNVVTQINNEQTWARSKIQGMLVTALTHTETGGQVLDGSKVSPADYQAVADSLANADAHLAKYESASKWPAEEKMSKPVIAGAKAMSRMMREQVTAIRNGDLVAYNQLGSQLMQPAEQFHDGLKALMEFSNARNSEMSADFQQTEDTFQWLYYGIVVLSILVIVVVYLGLRALVTKPLDRAVSSLQRIANADLSHPIVVPSRNEVGKLFAAMKHMQQSLGKIVGSTRQSSNSIRTGAVEIAKGNTDLSARTEEQAASLGETASSMEEITSTVKQNADNARQASTLANDASSTASRGGEVMAQVTSTMQGITESSGKISEIIGMIDAIAFQTNILALNASVEAARAGEQGRGFAVVAGEVRNLAGRSADAAREIKQLIEGSSGQVHEGSKLVQEAGKTMHEVVGAVKRVTDIMDEISAASQEQSAGIEQINQAVAQMDDVTQQNSALVEQITAAATSLEEQALRMEQEVSVFRLVGEQAVPAAARKPASAAASTPSAPINSPSSALKRPQLQATASTSSEDDWEEF